MKRVLARGFFILLLIQVLASEKTFATHLRAADILVERVCGSLTFKITVVVYLNSSSSTRFGTNGQVIFGDGQTEIIPVTESIMRPDLGTNISVATFTVMHTYNVSGTYQISYVERDRSRGVLNILDSHDVPYVSFININTDSKFECNRYPVLSVIPLDRGCKGITFYHNPGAFDLDGDSLSYELSIPSSSVSTFAIYDDPTNKKFYTNFNTGNEEKNGPPVFSIDAFTGLITWNAPGTIGEYNIAFKIIEWRKDSASGNFLKISSTTRDMQILIEECENTSPNLLLPGNLCVVAGTVVTGLIQGTDVENHPVKIEVFSEIFNMAADNSPATYLPVISDFVMSNPPAEINFEWNTNCLHVRQQPYQLVFKITDDPPDGPKLVSFKTWTIKVVAPAPVLKDVTLNVVKQYALLSWQEYSCNNADKIQVWRKVGSYNAMPGNCDIGIPRNSGYSLIKEVDAIQTSFTDTNYGMGLAAGAQYCYRLVALIADTKSLVSQEICIGPIKRDAPVITHVSVERTATEGSIRVSWRSPFDINKIQFPEPYAYEIFRAEGFIGDTSLVKVGYVSDTTFLDDAVNTSEKIFNYRIVLYAKPQFSETFIPVDTSSVASAVRLTAIPGLNNIQLQWRDSVPWSNVVQSRPYHLIYRASGVVPEDDLILYDSVNVIENGFFYTDQSIENNKIYTYRIVTRGTYGNPDISLQQNSSQIISLYPQNDLLPCVPLITIQKLDCEMYVNMNTCSQTEFTNSFTWHPVLQSSCRVDIKAYNIYTASAEAGEYTLLATVTDTSFIETKLPSAARCYRISAIDVLGKEGALSDPVCNDNCPYYELPNVFTPNDDTCNDLFTARFESDGASTDNACDPVRASSCPRFVNSVYIRIFNRWGKEVYYYSSDNGGSIYIDWNGEDNNGVALASGVYYYVADIKFNVLDPSNQRKFIKQWVHLLR